MNFLSLRAQVDKRLGLPRSHTPRNYHGRVPMTPSSGLLAVA